MAEDPKKAEAEAKAKAEAEAKAKADQEAAVKKINHQKVCVSDMNRKKKD